MWSFQGKILKRFQTDQFCQLLWRPRPASLLTAKQLKDIKKNLKKYSVHFDTKDKLRTTKASKELIDKRRAKYEEFVALKKKKSEEFEELKEKRLALRNGVDTDCLETPDANEMEEEVVEFLVKEEETIVD